jgi:hypothetical protein
MRWVFLIVGGIATVAMLAISMRLNYLFGYALGQTAEKALVFGWVSVVADAWKGLGPVFIVTLARERRWPTAGAATIVWAACFLYSVSSALGVAIQDRGALTGGRETLHAGYADALAEIETLEKKRSALSKHRPASEVDAAINAALMQPVMNEQRFLGTVGALSANCTRAQFRTVKSCAEIAALRQELAVAVEGGELDKKIADLRTRVNEFRERGATLSADPQAELFVRLTRGWLSVRDVGPGLALLLAVVIELVSAFGPAVLAGYADATRGRKDSTHEEETTKPLVVVGRALSQHVAARRDERDVVMEYMAERIAPAVETQAIGSDEIFADYVAWCSGRKYAALGPRDFLAEFDRKRHECHLEGKIRKFGKRYFGIRLSEAIAS